MNVRQAAFMIAEAARRERELDNLSFEEQGVAMADPVYERWLLESAEGLDYPWKRLWHRVRPPEWRKRLAESAHSDAHGEPNDQ